MATKRKRTVEYFPHYCEHEKTLRILERRFGNNGYAFYYKLREILGKTEGHFYDLNEPGTLEDLAGIARVGDDDVRSMLTLCAQLGDINATLYQQRNIIWSSDFVDNLAPLYSRRNSELPTPPHINVDIYPVDAGKCMHDDDNNPTQPGNCSNNVDISSQDAYKNPAQPVKQSRAEQSRGEREEEPRSGRRFFLPLNNAPASTQELDLAQVFLNFNPGGFPDQEKQLIALRDIMHRCENLTGQARDGPASGDIALAFVEAFKELRENDVSHKGFWRTMPMLRKFILTPWAQIIQHVKERGELAGADSDMGQILDELNF